MAFKWAAALTCAAGCFGTEFLAGTETRYFTLRLYGSLALIIKLLFGHAKSEVGNRTNFIVND